MFSRWLATTLVAAQLCAVAHLALVPHTSTVSGEVSTSVFALEQHLDAAAHPGSHAHAPAPEAQRQGEEHCVVLGLLRAASSAPPATALLATAGPAPELVAPVSLVFAPDRRALLLAAPKASPPVV